jgi:hypothetical protein
MAMGDHIYVVRPGWYVHHGIDCGDGTVIHFNGQDGKSKRVAAIVRDTLQAFLDGGELLVRRYGRREDPRATLDAALSRLGERNYNLLFNNCEHFATWCCTARRISYQVRRAVCSAWGAATIVAGAAGAGTCLSRVGLVAGVSGSGVMSALGVSGQLVGGTAAQGPLVLGAAMSAAMIAVVQRTLADDDFLTNPERAARRDGRLASVVGAAGGCAAGWGVLVTSGVSGLSAVGITTGLAAVGATVGGGMVAGVVVLAIALAVATLLAASFVYLLSRWLRGAPTR